METAKMGNTWPHLDYLSWRETCSALHLYLQIAGKYRLAHSPWLNHSWNATFYVTPEGLTSSLIPDGPGIEIRFDFQEHRVVGISGDGRRASFALGPSTVAAFHADFVRLVSELGGTPTFDGQPNEVPNPVPFSEDDRDRPYDRDAVQRFHLALWRSTGSSSVSDLLSRQSQPRSPVLGRSRSGRHPLFGTARASSPWRHSGIAGRRGPGGLRP
jgi:hypothetical protein